MMPEILDRIVFVINPVSGVRKKGVSDFRKIVEDHLREKGIVPVFYVTEYPGHAAELTAEGLEMGLQRFVAVGGDGTINEMAGVLAGSSALLGIIPAGSGNGLAHHLNIPSRTGHALDVILQGKVLSIDTCSIDGRIFTSIAGVGFDARVARQFAKSGKRGFLTYARIAIREYFSYKQRKFKLTIDGKEMQVRAFFISFANSNQFGYNTRIAPGASLTDGLMDVCVVKKPPVSAFPGILTLMLRRMIDHSRYMNTYQAKEVRVKRKKGKTANVDGESVKMGKSLMVSVRPSSLNVIIP